ncbi:MAG TPA: hypothetical protein GX512_00605 [Firmicutes bacterium]|nr:hypothetical protein [Candidatus Fermentithermobacillaceae bacterium]
MRERATRDDWAVRIVLALIVLVIGVQISLRFENLRRFLNVSIRMEGEALSESVPGLSEEAYPWLEWPPPDASSHNEAWATLYLRFLGEPPSTAWVLLDGRVAKRLGPEGGTVTVKSCHVIEVYSPGAEVSVLVSAATPNLLEPAPGRWVVARERVEIGEVRLRGPQDTE